MSLLYKLDMRQMLLLATMAGSLMVACGTNGHTHRATNSTVFYEASGSGAALVTYGNTSAGIRQESPILPWSTYQTAKNTDGITLRVRASYTGTVQCKITVNGETRVNNQSRGTNPVVACTTHG